MKDINNWMILFCDCIRNMSKYDVNIVLKKSKTIRIVEENITVSGGYWADYNEKNITFACTTGHPFEKWSQTFAHEYCHFLQWLDKGEVWKDFRKIKNEDLDKIFHNKPIKEETLDNVLRWSKNIELDCEKRTVKLLKKYKVDVDIKRYIQKANVYIHFYNYAKRYRQWYPANKNPFLIESLIVSAPDNFNGNYDEMPPEMLKEYEKHFPPKKTNRII